MDCSPRKCPLRLPKAGTRGRGKAPSIGVVGRHRLRERLSITALGWLTISGPIQVSARGVFLSTLDTSPQRWFDRSPRWVAMWMSLCTQPYVTRWRSDSTSQVFVWR